MKTLLIKMIDGIEIVTGFGKLQINPVETRENFNEKLKSLPEFKELEDLSSKYAKHICKTGAKKSEYEKELKELKEKKAQVEEVMKKNHDYITYFGLKENERAIPEEDFKAFKEKYSEIKKTGSLMSIDKLEVKNLKGNEYFLRSDGNITREVINKIGEDFPAGAILKLTEDERMSMLSVAEKENEYKTKKSKIIEETKNRIIDLMLEGKSQAMANTTAIGEFKPKVDDLKLKYLN